MVNVSVSYSGSSAHTKGSPVYMAGSTTSAGVLRSASSFAVITGVVRGGGSDDMSTSEINARPSNGIPSPTTNH